MSDDAPKGRPDKTTLRLSPADWAVVERLVERTGLRSFNAVVWLALHELDRRIEAEMTPRAVPKIPNKPG